MLRKSKSSVFKKSKKRIRNKNKRKQTKKIRKSFRLVTMYGGAYDTNPFFRFPEDSAIFHGEFSTIKFETISGATYNISKNPNELLKLCPPRNWKGYESESETILRKMIQRVRMKINIANYINNTLSGMFFLYGIDEVSYGRPRYYGLFYLLTRIELLAVLLQSKKNPKFQDNFKDVNFPINDSSILPGDYNNYPWGYLYLFDRTDRNHDQILLSFINFSEKLGQVKTKLLEFAPSAAPSEELQIQQQQEIIGEIELPTSSSIKLMRMLPKIEIYTPPGEESRFVDLYKG